VMRALSTVPKLHLVRAQGILDERHTRDTLSVKGRCRHVVDRSRGCNSYFKV
jgi:hypothetical protein